MKVFLKCQNCRVIWQYQYDTARNLIQSTDAEGHAKGYSYYPDNSLASTTVPVTFTDTSGTPSLTNVVEQYQRDALGHLTCLIDGNYQSTGFTYDGLGRKTSTIRDPDDSTRSKTETTYYDALLPTASVDAKGQRKEFSYDAQFQLQELDVIGHSEQSLSFIHDLLGRVTNIAPTNPSLNTSPGNPSIARSYDVLGRLQTELSNGVTTTYGYDLLGQLTHISNSANIREIYIRHDAAGRTSQIDDYYGSPLFPLSTRFGYDLAGHQVVESMPNNLQKIAQLDPMGRVTCQTLLAANLNEISHTETQYDLLSNVTHIKEAYAPTLNIPSRTVDNTYNERSQLLTENQNETGGPLVNSTRTRVTTHRYDAAENRISTQSSIHDPLTIDSTLTRLFEYGDDTNGYNSNQIYQLTETPGAGSPTITKYEYDANGNRTKKTIGSLSDLYQYDSFNRLTQLTLTTTGGDNGIYQYSYDPLTRRISRTVSNTSNTRQFAFSGSTPAHEWYGTQPPSSASMSDIIGGGLDSQLHIQASNGVTTYPIQNLRGDITSQVNNAGSMSWHGTYSADGLLQNQYGTRLGDYGANGKFEEPGGLLNEGFRYRDRLTGTFLTRDPAGFIDGPNDYNYVGHNPWSAWDPNGLDTITTATVGYVPYSVAAVGGATSGVNSGIGSSFPLSNLTSVGGVVATTSGGNPVATNDSTTFWNQYDALARIGLVTPRPNDLMSIFSGYTQVSLHDAEIVAGALGGQLQNYNKSWPWQSTSLASSSDLWILPQSASLGGQKSGGLLDANFASLISRYGDVLDFRVMQATAEATSSYPWGTLSIDELSIAMDRGYISFWNMPICANPWSGRSNTPDGWTPVDHRSMDYAIQANPFSTPMDIGAQLLVEFASAGTGEWLQTVPRGGTVSIPATSAKALAPVEKFSNYIFKEGATHGKDAVFRSLGYSGEHSAQLSGMWEEQAAAKFSQGDYALGKLDEYGQRITITIEVPGIGQAAGKTSFMQSGWMINPDGSIKMNTPFTGFPK